MSALSAAAQDEDGDIIKTLQARVADLEAQLYAVGAGGVGKLEQPQSVTDCHQSQPQGGQEPVAWMHQCRKKPELVKLSFKKREPALAASGYKARPLIFGDTAKPRQPLTDEQQIAEAMRRHGLVLVKTVNGYDVLKLGQITAHKIGGEA